MYKYILIVLLSVFVSCSQPPQSIDNPVYPYEYEINARVQAVGEFKPSTGYLTFDDFNESTNKPQLDKILAVLDKYNAKATFFVNCERLVNEPATLEWMKLIVSKGHTLGNHSYTHFHEALDFVSNPENRLKYPEVILTQVSRYYTWYYGYEVGYQKLKEEVGKCDQVLGNIKGYKKIFRPPFGEVSPVLMSALVSVGYNVSNIVLFDVDGCDYISSTTAEEIKESILMGTLPKYCAEGQRIVTTAFKDKFIVDLHWSDGSQTAEGLELTLKQSQGKILWKRL